MCSTADVDGLMLQDESQLDSLQLRILHSACAQALLTAPRIAPLSVLVTREASMSALAEVGRSAARFLPLMGGSSGHGPPVSSDATTLRKSLVEAGMGDLLSPWLLQRMVGNYSADSLLETVSLLSPLYDTVDQLDGRTAAWLHETSAITVHTDRLSQHRNQSGNTSCRGCSVGIAVALRLPAGVEVSGLDVIAMDPNAIVSSYTGSTTNSSILADAVDSAVLDFERSTADGHELLGMMRIWPPLMTAAMEKVADEEVRQMSPYSMMGKRRARAVLASASIGDEPCEAAAMAPWPFVRPRMSGVEPLRDGRHTVSVGP